MKRFKVTVQREDVYIIELNELLFSEDWMKQFREEFYDFHTLEQHAEHIAQLRARFGGGRLEGYGVPLINGKTQNFYDHPEAGININIVSEDEECDAYTEELK
ncbi:hypothetical protein EEL30_21515 [Brevibacillus laterosporus]|uniref:Uncharacterized protein n=1 Tax=Brevibacillus laterosporus TaxID=1465 RepID=A0A518VCA2_BRELA|nr:hypothetical protein EEL30_21515 [Brevibacillus laterosporus]